LSPSRKPARRNPKTNDGCLGRCQEIIPALSRGYVRFPRPTENDPGSPARIATFSRNVLRKRASSRDPGGPVSALGRTPSGGPSGASTRN
jgi:hypothetical protein